MIEKNINKILVIMVILLLMLTTKSYAETKIKMEINNGTPWTSVTITDSYNICQELNSETSTLGTASLEAHLSTEYDWNAMAIFAASSHGTATSNDLGKDSTTSNASGIYGINESYYFQTSAVLKGAVSIYTEHISGLFNVDGSLKKYVNRFDKNGYEYGTTDGTKDEKTGNRTPSFSVLTTSLPGGGMCNLYGIYYRCRRPSRISYLCASRTYCTKFW